MDSFRRRQTLNRQVNKYNKQSGRYEGEFKQILPARTMKGKK